MKKRMQGESRRLGIRLYQDSVTYDVKRQAFSNSSYMFQNIPSSMNHFSYQSGPSDLTMSVVGE